MNFSPNEKQAHVVIPTRGDGEGFHNCNFCDYFTNEREAISRVGVLTAHDFQVRGPLPRSAGSG